MSVSKIVTTEVVNAMPKAQGYRSDKLGNNVVTKFTTEVVNANKSHYDVWIGGMSRGASIWANHFSIVEHGRSGSYELYESHIRNSPELIEKLQWLKGKRLGCYCAPSYCHGHVLQKLIHEYYG